MGLFGFGKKKEKETKTNGCGCGDVQETANSGCCCGGEAKESTTGCCCGGADAAFSIKILGAGCKSCHELYENTKAAIANMGLPVEVEYITDMEKVMAYGAMSMPAIVVNEKVVCMGKVLKTVDVEKLVHKLGY